MNQPFDWIANSLHDLEQRQLLRRLVDRSGPQGATVRIDAHDYLNFGSNDYLGLADHPEIRAEVSQALLTHGVGSGASPLILGHSRAHAELESALAEFEQQEAALVFSTGYAANTGTICALAGEADAIFSDAKNHASIIDGCRLSRASVHVFAHGDLTRLEELLAASSGFRRRLIVTDGLFSMDGDVAPLAELAQLSERFQAMLLVDEAHATGVLGPTGRGAAQMMGVSDHPCLIRTGTLSKALGALGGFVVAERQTIDWIANTARTYVFSTALPAAICQAALIALRIVQSEPDRRERVMRCAAELRSRLKNQGFASPSTCGPIIPVRVGDAGRVMRIGHQLRERGVFVPAIRPPSVPKGESLLRISLSADHTDQMIDQLWHALVESLVSNATG